MTTRIEITLEWYTWRRQEFIAQLEADTKQVAECEPRPKVEEKDGVVTNQAEIDKYDSGLRRLIYSNKFSLDLDALPKYLPCTVVGVQQTVSIEKFEQRVAPVMNERCKVVVPGPALLSYNEVAVEKDCCTDHLQTKLDEGWRILAIAVQPDQRRPDYILGRVNEELDDDLKLADIKAKRKRTF